MQAEARIPVALFTLVAASGLTMLAMIYLTYRKRSPLELLLVLGIPAIIAGLLIGGIAFWAASYERVMGASTEIDPEPDNPLPIPPAAPSSTPGDNAHGRHDRAERGSPGMQPPIPRAAPTADGSSGSVGSGNGLAQSPPGGPGVSGPHAGRPASAGPAAHAEAPPHAGPPPQPDLRPTPERRATQPSHS